MPRYSNSHARVCARSRSPRRSLFFIPREAMLSSGYTFKCRATVADGEATSSYLNMIWA
jgi:hypothetical protein